MTVQEIEKSYGICGLVCALCSFKTGRADGCAGCRGKKSDCEVKDCCVAKGLDYCFQCKDFPCGKKMFSNRRIKTFNQVARDEGLNALAGYLHKNMERGIYYHCADGHTGDYDKCQTEQEIIDLLKNGRPDAYEKCPEYESKNF